jgi:hypothetical protein
MPLNSSLQCPLHFHIANIPLITTHNSTFSSRQFNNTCMSHVLTFHNDPSDLVFILTICKLTKLTRRETKGLY